MMQFSKREIKDKENKNGDNPVQTYISTEEHGSVFIANREVVPMICNNTVSFQVIHEF